MENFFILNHEMNESDILAKGKKAFLEELSSQIKALQESLPIEEAIQIFHKIKGGAGFFGLHQIREAASIIEKEAKKGDLAEDSLKKFLELCLNTVKDS